jgi:hypothetical protein
MGTRPAQFRVFLNVPRPSLRLVEKFGGIPTGNICDAMDRFGAMDYHIQALDRNVRLCGTAITVRTRPCDKLIIYKALEIAQPGDVLVIACHENSEVVGSGPTSYREKYCVRIFVVKASISVDGRFRRVLPPKNSQGNPRQSASSGVSSHHVSAGCTTADTDSEGLQIVQDFRTGLDRP